MLAIHLKMNKELNYNHDISTLNGVGPKIKNTLNSIGLNDLSDLIFYFPRKYNDYRNLKKISDLKDGEEVTIKGKILFSGLLKWRRKIYEVVIIRNILIKGSVIFTNTFIKKNSESCL